jgi:hypothetical protein
MASTQQLLIAYARPTAPTGDWILETGFWNDSGVWKDTSAWID